MEPLSPRHIQDFNNASSLEPHWGYADRVIPCKNDAGSCAYLDVVYHSHDLGMLYSAIIWATVGGSLLVWFLVRKSYFLDQASHSYALDAVSEGGQKPRNALSRYLSYLSTSCRRRLLPETFRPIFGHTTRLQVLALAVLVGYLTIWTFVGIVYSMWITPIKNSALHNTRTSLGPFADRVGLLAYALIPFSIMLSSRESILSLVTGIPYQHFNFLHQWLGYIIFAQSIIHTVGWTVVETVLYQPQPKTGREWITQNYMIWGIVAQILVTFIFVSSLSPVIKLTGYEFFRKAHYIVAMLFVGACWAHWSNLACFMIASLTVWLLDRGVRLVRIALLHYNYLPTGKMGFVNAKARIVYFPDALNGDVIRLDFEHPQDAWEVGQHFYLCFPEISIWQSHPFTPASMPAAGSPQQHTYVIRSKRGETKNLAQLAISKTLSTGQVEKQDVSPNSLQTTPVILAGPYGEAITSNLDSHVNILCIAGGTGVTYVLPVLLSLATQTPSSPDRKIRFVWAIRMGNDAKWIRSELETLEKAAKHIGLDINIYITRECCTTSAPGTASATSAKKSDKQAIASAEGKVLSSTSASSLSDNEMVDIRGATRPNLASITKSFVDNTIRGPTTVFASGPAGMISDLRTAVAQCNNPRKVLQGQERWNVRLVSDDRMEW